MLVSELIPDRFEYRQGATYVDSPLIDVLDGGAGVCQDFVHLGLNLLRRHGIAGRYVSGYLFTTADGDADARVGRGRHPRLDRGAAASGDDGEPRLGQHRPDQPRAGRRAPRQDRPRPPLRRRAADQGRLPRAANAALEASVTMTISEGPDPASAVRA